MVEYLAENSRNGYQLAQPIRPARLLAQGTFVKHVSVRDDDGLGVTDFGRLRSGVVSDAFEHRSRNTSATRTSSLFHPFTYQNPLSHLWDDNQFFALRARAMGISHPNEYLRVSAGLLLCLVPSVECGDRDPRSSLAFTPGRFVDLLAADRLDDPGLPGVGLANLPTTVRRPVSEY